MSIIKKIATGALVNWSASKGGYKSQSGSFVMPDDTYRFRVVLEPTIVDYWAVWEGGSSAQFYRNDNNYTSKYSPTRKTDLSFNPIRMRFPTSTTSVSYIDGSTLTNAQRMFGDCEALESVPLFDTSNVTGSMGDMFMSCTSLTSIPALDTRNVTSMGFMFYNCTALTSIPALDTRNVTNMFDMFFLCTSLKTIPLLNMSNVDNAGFMFSRCSSLENITLEGSLNVGVDFSACTKLTYNSILSILTAAANTGNLNSKTLVFNRTIKDQGRALATLVTACVSKNWTITGLTLV